MSRSRAVVCLLALVLLCAGTWTAEARGEELPPPRVIDRRTGKELAPGGAARPPAPAPRADRQAAPRPAEAAPPRPADADRPDVREPAGPSLVCPAPGTADPRWTTPRDGAVARGTDLRPQIPFIGIHYAFTGTSTNDEFTRGSDTLDVTVLHAVNDRLLVGAMGRWLVDHDEAISGGPVVNFTLLHETESLPTVQAGGFWLLGDSEEADRRVSLFLAGSKRLPLPASPGLVRGLRINAGVAYNWRTQKYFTDGWEAWLQPELELPEGFSIFGEVNTNCSCDLSLSAGINWASPWGINFTVSVFDCVGSYQGFRGFVDYADGFRRSGGKPTARPRRGPEGRSIPPTKQVRGQTHTPRTQNAHGGFEVGD